MEAIPPKVLEALSLLQPEGNAEVKMVKVVEEALLRRLHHYQYVDRRLQQKYAMTFAQFRDGEVMRQHGRGFDAESDFWEWELAHDGIRTMERQLSELRRPADDRW